MSEPGFTTLAGRTITGIVVTQDHPMAADNIVFYTQDGGIYRLYHQQSCCESVTINDIAGDMNDLIGFPLRTAEERTSDTKPEDEAFDYGGSQTWTFYELATWKGSVTIRWHGVSNGYYSESVTFEKER